MDRSDIRLYSIGDYPLVDDKQPTKKLICCSDINDSANQCYLSLHNYLTESLDILQYSTHK